MKRISWMLGVALVMCPIISVAQELPRSHEGRARWYNARGDQLIRVNPAEAAQFYLRAYAEVPDCGLLFNAASAFERTSTLDGMERSVANYQAYLQSDRERCRSLRFNETLARNSLARLEEEIRLRRQALPPVSTLTVVQTPPVPVAVVTPPPVVVTPPPVVLPPRYRTERASANLSYTLWGVGALTMGFGIYSLVVASDEYVLSRQQGVADPGRHTRAAESASLWGGVTLGAGLVAASAGFIWYMLRPRRQVLIAPLASSQVVGLTALVRFQ